MGCRFEVIKCFIPCSEFDTFFLVFELMNLFCRLFGSFQTCKCNKYATENSVYCIFAHVVYTVADIVAHHYRPSADPQHAPTGLPCQAARVTLTNSDVI